MYNWAKGDHKPLATQRHFTLDISNDSSSEIGSISFEKSVILDVKKYIERELSAEASSQKSFYFSGVKSDAGSLKSNYYIVEMLDMKLAGQSSLGKYSGLFAALTPQNSIEEVEEFCKKELSAGGLKFAMIYQLKSESFSLIPLNRDRAFEAKKYWIKFSIQDIVPFLIK